MTKIKLALLLPLFLTGCTMSDGELRNAYVQHYQQPTAYVDTYKQKITSVDIHALTQYTAAEDKKKMCGQPRLKIGKFITIENMRAKENRAVYDYSLSENRLVLSADKRRGRQTNMNKDLIHRACSLGTVRLAQAEGLEEEHDCYGQYPGKVTFTLRTSAQICLQNDFTQQPQSQSLMRCVYQAYDLHTAVSRIRHQRAGLSAERFYTIAVTTEPDTLRLSGLRLARCRRPDKAPMRRSVYGTVLHNGRNRKA